MSTHLARILEQRPSVEEWLVHLNDSETVGLIECTAGFLGRAITRIVNFDGNSVLAMTVDLQTGFLIDYEADDAAASFELEAW